jgi:hypothetical protein
MLSFMQIWNNKNFDTFLNLVGFFFVNCHLKMNIVHCFLINMDGRDRKE